MLPKHVPLSGTSLALYACFIVCFWYKYLELYPTGIQILNYNPTIFNILVFLMETEDLRLNHTLSLSKLSYANHINYSQY